MRFIQTLDSKDPVLADGEPGGALVHRGNLAAALFLLGSILFAVDGMVYLSTMSAINVNYVLYTLGSFLFAAGSAAMLTPQSQ